MGFDTETNITDDIPSRECYVMQLGDHEEQVVIDWLRAPQWARDWVRNILEDENRVKIIHNASFDLKVCWNCGINATNIHDTMVCHQALHNGLTVKNASLAELLEIHLFVYLDKSLQTSYNGEPLTTEQIRYAALDVKYLPILQRIQILESNEFQLQATLGLENATAEALARIEYDGVELSPERWKEAKVWAETEFYRVVKNLQETVENDPRLLEYAISNNYIVAEDRLNINWNSPPQKKLIAEYFFPPLTGLSKPILKRACQLATQAGEEEYAEMFLNAMNDDYTLMEKYILQEDRQWLIDRELLYPAGSCRFNWNSNPQMLALGKIIAPHLRSMQAKNISKRDHPFFHALVTYGEWFKRISTYGEDFLRHIQSDGRVHTRYNNIVDTGRTSSESPNLQNIPQRGAAKAHYRRAFVPAPGNKFAIADYAGQEIVLAATIYREPVWLEALKKGHDLHSVVGELIFNKEWKTGTRPGCQYYHNNQRHKCDVCPQHGEIRSNTKNFNFGLLYGMTEAGLAERLGRSRQEALNIKLFYFSKLKHLKYWMDKFTAFALYKGYIRGPWPIGRIRWFKGWEEVKHEAHNFIKGISNEYTLGEIARQAVNMPVQGEQHCPD
jgi:DNA polymerase I-like protein with 3'-5' exonuclease and polymerase domains